MPILSLPWKFDIYFINTKIFAEHNFGPPENNLGPPENNWAPKFQF